MPLRSEMDGNQSEEKIGKAEMPIRPEGYIKSMTMGRA